MAHFRELRSVAAVLALCIPGSLVFGNELRDNSALRWVPDSSAFYVSVMRLEEQWQAFANSKAYDSLRRMPLIQMGAIQFKQRWTSADGDLGQFKEFLESPENAGLVQLAKELFAREFFICGDQSLGDLIYELNRANQMSSLAQLQKLSGNDQSESVEQQQVEMIIEALRRAEVPNLVMGFRVGDPDNAMTQVGRLEGLLQQQLEDYPELAERVKRTESEGGEFLQCALDAQMIPWEKAMDDSDLDPQQVEALRNALEGKELYISIGVIEGYVYLGVTDGPDPIEMFHSESLLIDSEPFAKVREFEEKKFTSVGYVSGDFLRAISRPKEDMRQFGAMAKAVVGQTDLDQDLIERIQSDVDELVEDITEFIPEQGTAILFEYLTDSGYEGYQQTWAENKFLDPSKPLEVLKQVGDPLLMYAARNVVPEDATKKTMKWIERGCYYIERFARESDDIDEAQLALAKEFADRLGPFFQRWVEISETQMKAALRDGESAFVIDSKIDPKLVWHPIMAPAEEPLPMLEFASVSRVSDDDALEAGLREYCELGDDALDELKKIFAENSNELAEQLDGPAEMLPAMIQQLQLPTPVKKEVDGGRIYSLTTLNQFGLDEVLAPCLGWSEDMMVMSMSPETVERFLGNRQVAAAFEDNLDRPLASAMHLNFAGLINSIKPWIDYGLSQAAQQEGGQMILMFTPQLDTVIDFMTCFESYTSVTYAEGESLVTFYRQDFQDLD